MTFPIEKILKKLSLTVGSFFFLIMFPPNGMSVESGDVNDDKIVNLTDVILSLQLLTGQSAFNEIHVEADADGDNKIGLSDVIFMLEKTSQTVPPSFLIKESDYSGFNYQGTFWLSASVRNALGDFITDLTVDDIQLTEYIISKADGTVKAEAVIDMPAFAAGDDERFGFFKSVTGGKPVDIVFLLDSTGSMADYYPNLKLQLTSLVNEMVENHVDFRVAVRYFDYGPGGDNYWGFYGPHEVDRLLDNIDLMEAVGGGHEPSTAYDALLFTPWLGFRDGARKVCVAVTDIVPQTVYGTFWYTPDSSAATRTAAELFLQNLGIELFYVQPEVNPEEPITSYYDQAINPRAGDSASGFSALKNTTGTPLATKLNFPFNREELKTALGITNPFKVTDTRYLLSWESSFSWLPEENVDLYYHPEDYELRVTLKVPDPDQPLLAMPLTESCTYPIKKGMVDIVLNVINEEGSPSTNLWASVYHKMGGREIAQAGQLPPVNGQISIINLPKGIYNVLIRAAGFPTYSYGSLRAIHRETINVSQEDMAFNMIVPVADQDAELYKTRGLLQDIGDWRLPGDPFQEMVDNATSWLDTMEIDGLCWEEMVAIKRFYVGLSGFANVIEYSQLEAEGAVEDFTKIVKNFRGVMEQVEKLNSETETAWAAEILSGVIKAAMCAQPASCIEYNALEEALNLALKNLETYVTEDLTRDLRNKIIEQFPLGDYNTLLQTIVNTLIDAAFGDNTVEPDWEPVLNAIRTIALDEAIEELQEEVSQIVVTSIVDAAIQNLPLSSGLTTEIKKLLQNILKALISGDIQGDTFSLAIENFATGLADDVLTTEPDTIALAVNNVFDAVDDALNQAGIDPDISGFLVGMARELTLLAIPEKVNNILVKYDMETDEVVTVLVKYGVYYVILKDYCIDDIQLGLEQLLDGALNHVPVGDNKTEWTIVMDNGDFPVLRGIVGDLQGNVWDAIRVQNAITEWAQQMQELCELLEAISAPLDFLGTFSSDLEQAAEYVHLLITVLDGMQILPNAISFGLKVESLDTLGDSAEPMHQVLFY